MNEQSNGQTLTTVNGTSLTGYGERAEVRELATRMMKFHPAYKDVGETGMIAVAQLAILSGANPLPTAGEIYAWIDWRGDLVAMLGIAYWRRKAREVDAPIWFVDSENPDPEQRSYEPRQMLDAEREAYGVLDGDIAAICKAYRLSEYLKLLATDTPWQVAQQMLTRTGIGIVKHRETVAQKATRTRKIGDPIDPPHGRTWAWVACKRAEQDVYRALSLINENFIGSQPQPIHQPQSSLSDLSLDELNDELFG